MELASGEPRFTTDDLLALSGLVSSAWASGAERDWSVPAGTLEWSCLATADHAVDCVYAPAFFLASRRLDGYPDVGEVLLGERADPRRLVESLSIATRLLVAVVRDAPDEARAAIFRGPPAVVAGPVDFPPRAALELILHAHDVCAGLGVPFEPDPDLCERLREHTRPWPLWAYWGELPRTDDPWADLLGASGRNRLAP